MSVESGKVLRRAHFAAAVQALSVGPDGAQVAVGTRDGIIQLLPIDIGPNSKEKAGAGEPASLAAHERRVTSLAWIDRDRVASVSRDGSCVISTTRANDANSVSGSLQSIRIAVSDDGRWIVAHDFHRLQLIDTRERNVRDLGATTAETYFAGVTFTPGSDQLLVATSDDKLLITPTSHLDPDHQRSLNVTDDFSDLRFSEDGRRLLMHSRSDRVLAVVEYPSMREILRKPCPDSYTAAISSDGRQLAMSFQGDVFVHDLDSGELIAESKDHHYETINDLRFGPQGRWIATISDDRTVRLWNFRSSEPPALLGAHPNGVPKGLWISADGRTLITHSRSGEVWAWSVMARQKLFPICRSDSGYKESALSADDSTLVTVDGEGKIDWYTFTDRHGDAKK